MIKVTKEVIDFCAENLLFKLNPGQTDLIYEEFNTIMAQIDFLKGIPGVDDADPMTFPYSEHQKFLRKDKPVKPIKAEVELSNSNTRIGNQIKLPKVVGNKNDEIDE
jgi:aspartyl/glutamyl-tRNA(Asn/Gln) amidotransferase C subunit